jgi:ribose transport system permease protein
MESNKFMNKIQDLGALIALIGLVLVISIISPQFRTIDNFLSLVRQSSINGFIAFGMTCVILTGGIDLSVGSTLALATAFCASFIKGGMPVGIAMILALLIGVGCGLVSGTLVTKGRLQPFIATLITMTVYRGVTMIFMDGKPISGLGSSFLLKFVGKGSLFGIPFPVLLFVLVFLLFFFVLQNCNITLYIVVLLPYLKILLLSSLLVCCLLFEEIYTQHAHMREFLMNKTVCSHRAYSSGSIT